MRCLLSPTRSLWIHTGDSRLCWLNENQVLNQFWKLYLGLKLLASWLIIKWNTKCFGQFQQGKNPQHHGVKLTGTDPPRSSSKRPTNDTRPCVSEGQGRRSHPRPSSGLCDHSVMLQRKCLLCGRAWALFVVTFVALPMVQLGLWQKERDHRNHPGKESKKVTQNMVRLGWPSQCKQLVTAFWHIILHPSR